MKLEDHDLNHMLPLSGRPPLERVKLVGRVWHAKHELHVTLVTGDRWVERMMETERVGEEHARRLIYEIVHQSAALVPLYFEGLTGEFRLVRRDDRETIIAMCHVDGLGRLYTHLEQRVGWRLERPPAHVTLFTAANGLAIGITSEAELEENSRPLDADEAAPLHRALTLGPTVPWGLRYSASFK